MRATQSLAQRLPGDVGVASLYGLLAWPNTAGFVTLDPMEDEIIAQAYDPDGLPLPHTTSLHPSLDAAQQAMSQRFGLQNWWRVPDGMGSHTAGMTHTEAWQQRESA